MFGQVDVLHQQLHMLLQLDDKFGSLLHQVVLSENEAANLRVMSHRGLHAEQVR